MPNPYDCPNFSQAFVITPDEVAVIQGPTQGNNRPTPYASAFVTDTDGTVTVIPKDNTTATGIVIPVIAGVIVRLAIKQLLSVSTSMVVTGFL